MSDDMLESSWVRENVPEHIDMGDLGDQFMLRMLRLERVGLLKPGTSDVTVEYRRLTARATVPRSAMAEVNYELAGIDCGFSFDQRAAYPKPVPAS